MKSLFWSVGRRYFRHHRGGPTNYRHTADLVAQACGARQTSAPAKVLHPGFDPPCIFIHRTPLTLQGISAMSDAISVHTLLVDPPRPHPLLGVGVDRTPVVKTEVDTCQCLS